MAPDYPLIVSADDHLVEPPDLWTSRLPMRYRDTGPRLVRQRVPSFNNRVTLDMKVSESDDGQWADVWYYEDQRFPLMLQAAVAGFPRAEVGIRATTFDEIRPGCWKPADRLLDMDIAGIDAQLCFPNRPPYGSAAKVSMRLRTKTWLISVFRPTTTSSLTNGARVRRAGSFHAAWFLCGMPTSRN